MSRIGQPSRRQALALGGSLTATAGAAFLAGCASGTPARHGGHGSAGESARASVSPSGVLRFESRPDLRPSAARITTNTGAAEPGVILLDSHGGAGQQGPMILDRAGNLVWFKGLSSDATSALRAFNLRVQTYRGEPLLTWWQGAVVDGHGQGHYVLANSRYQQVKTVRAHGGLQGDLHEFLLTASGTALFICYQTASADLRALGGMAGEQYFDGVVQEVDLATDKLVFQWRSDQHVPLSDSYVSVPPRAANPWDPFHLNSISVAPDGNLIVSARNAWTVYKINRTSGAVIWQLGGKHSDFTMSRRTRFAWQHHVTAHPDGIFTIFDNEAGDYRVGKQSRGLVLRVDEAAGTVSFVRQFNPPVHILSGALGSVQELPGGHVFMGWGERPYFTEYGSDGSIVFDGHLTSKHSVDYRAFKSPWTGRPAGRPAVAVRKAGNSVSAYVSWNGDTEVRRWRLLSGRTPTALAVVASAARSGFETKIRVSQPAGYLAIAGLDEHDRELGRSAVSRL